MDWGFSLPVPVLRAPRLSARCWGWPSPPLSTPSVSFSVGFTPVPKQLRVTSHGGHHPVDSHPFKCAAHISGGPCRAGDPPTPSTRCLPLGPSAHYLPPSLSPQTPSYSRVVILLHVTEEVKAIRRQRPHPSAAVFVDLPTPAVCPPTPSLLSCRTGPPPRMHWVP